MIALSDPAAEYEETLVKSRTMATAIALGTARHAAAAAGPPDAPTMHRAAPARHGSRGPFHTVHGSPPSSKDPHP